MMVTLLRYFNSLVYSNLPLTLKNINIQKMAYIIRIPPLPHPLYLNYIKIIHCLNKLYSINIV